MKKAKNFEIILNNSLKKDLVISAKDVILSIIKNIGYLWRFWLCN